MNRKSIYGIIAIVIVLTLVLVAYVGIGADGTWDTPWSPGKVAGIWEEEIILTYTDGTTQSLKILEDNFDNPFAVVQYNGKTLSSAKYSLFATATATGYTGCEIQAFSLTYKYYQGHDLLTSPTPMSGIGGSTNSPIRTISLGTKTELVSVSCAIQTDLGNKAVGPYTFKCEISPVTIGYKGVPDDGSGIQTVASPSAKTIKLTVVNTNQILLNLELTQMG